MINKNNKKRCAKGVICVLFSLFFVQFVIATIIEDQTSTTVTLSGTMRCSSDGRSWIDATGDAIQTILTQNECNKWNGMDITGFNSQEYCCPSGFQCTEHPDEFTWGCDPTLKLYCTDFNYSQQDCNVNGTFSVANYTAYIRRLNSNYSVFSCGIDYSSGYQRDADTYCYNLTNCNCGWGSNSGCSLVQQQQTVCSTVGVDPVLSPVGSCISSILEQRDECDTKGVYTIVWNSTRTGNYVGECENPPESEIPCDTVTKLGFFDSINILEVIFALLIIYIFMNIKKIH